MLPTPGVLSTPIVPPISSTSCFAIVSPSPVPPKRLLVEASACEKGWKIRSTQLGLDPDAGVADLEAQELRCTLVGCQARR